MTNTQTLTPYTPEQLHILNSLAYQRTNGRIQFTGFAFNQNYHFRFSYTIDGEPFQNPGANSTFPLDNPEEIIGSLLQGVTRNNW